ncbi:MAG: acetolactate synthase small subunit [Rikenellaceae bacterium]
MEKQEYIVTAFTENQVGVLNRITAIYLRRKINIESLRVAESSIKGLSMFVITALTTHTTIEKVVKHINKIVEVLDAKFYTSSELITQEVALYKISKDVFADKSANEVVTGNKNARVIEFGGDYIVVELTGSKEDITTFKNELEEKHILVQFTSSGSVIIHRENIDFKI